MKIRNLVEANKVLRKYVPLIKEMTGKDLTLDRTISLMKVLGNPQDKIKIVHIAGTSGKTSTSYYISKLLSLSGKKIGLTVSPHLDSITERIQINGTPISEAKFCKYLEEFLNIIKNEKSTYFELMIAFAYFVFYREKVDYAVMETGLGGLQDSTNVAQQKNKICVITDIGFDHMKILGNTLSEIASQKAGIIWSKNNVFIYDQKKEVLDQVKARVKKYKARLHIIPFKKQKSYGFLKSVPLFQKRNWLLSKSVLDFIVKRDSLKPLKNLSLEESTKIQVPARMESKNYKRKTIIMDGAHNLQKMQAFVKSLKDKYKNKKFNILLAMKEGKEYMEVLKELKPFINKLIITTFETAQDLPVSSIAPEIIVEACNSFKIKNVQIITDNKKALDKLFLLKGKNFIVTGSFYLLSEIRRYIK